MHFVRGGTRAARNSWRKSFRGFGVVTGASR
jgi:hypothetical protein